MSLQGIRTLVLLSLLFFSYEVIVVKNPANKPNRLLDPIPNPPMFSFSKTEIYGKIFNFAIDFVEDLNMKVIGIDLVCEGYNLNFENKEWTLTKSNQITLKGRLNDTQIFETFNDETEKSFYLQVTFSNGNWYRYVESKYQTIKFVLYKKSASFKFKGLIDKIEGDKAYGKGYKKVEIEGNLNGISYEVEEVINLKVSDRKPIVSEIDLEVYLGKLIILIIYNSDNTIAHITEQIMILDESGFSFSFTQSLLAIKASKQTISLKITLLNPVMPYFEYLDSAELFSGNNVIEFSDYEGKTLAAGYTRVYSYSFIITKEYEGEYMIRIKFAGKEVIIYEKLYITENLRKFYNLSNVEACTYIKEDFKVYLNEWQENIRMHIYFEQYEKYVQLDTESYWHFLLTRDKPIQVGPAKLYIFEGDLPKNKEDALEVFDIYFSDIMLDPNYIFESIYKPWVFDKIKFLKVGCNLSENKALNFEPNKNFTKKNELELKCDFYSEKQTLECNWDPYPLKGVFNIILKKKGVQFFISDIVIYRYAPIGPIVALPLKKTNQYLNEIKFNFPEKDLYKKLFFVTITREDLEEYYYKHYTHCPPGDTFFFSYESETVVAKVNTVPKLIYEITKVVYFDHTLIDYSKIYEFGYLFETEKYVFVQRTGITLNFEAGLIAQNYEDKIQYMKQNNVYEKLTCKSIKDNSLFCSLPINIQVSTGYVGVGDHLISSQTVHFVDYIISETCTVFSSLYCSPPPIHLELITPVDCDPIVYRNDTEIKMLRENINENKYTYLYKFTSLNLIIGDNTFDVIFDKTPKQDIPGLVVTRKPDISFGPPSKTIAYVSDPGEFFTMEIYPPVEISQEIPKIVLKNRNGVDIINIETPIPITSCLSSTIVVTLFGNLPPILNAGIYDIYYITCNNNLLIPTGQYITLLYNYATHIVLPAKHIMNECGLPTTHRIYYKFPVQYYPPQRIIIKNDCYQTVLEFGLLCTEETHAMQFTIPANLPILPGVYHVVSDYGRGYKQSEIPLFYFFLYPIVIQPSHSFVPVGTTKILHRLKLVYPILDIQIQSIGYVSPIYLHNDARPIHPSDYSYLEIPVRPGGDYILEPGNMGIIVENKMDFVFVNSTYKLRVYEFGTLEYSDYTYIAVDPPLSKKYLKLECGGVAELGPNYCYVIAAWEGYNLAKIQTITFEEENLIYHNKSKIVFCNPNSTLPICEGAPTFEIAPNAQLLAIIQYSDSMLFKYKYMLVEIAEDTSKFPDYYITYNETDNHIFSDYYQYKEFFYLGKNGLDQLNNVIFDVISTERIEIIKQKIHYTVGSQGRRTAKCTKVENTTKISCNFEFDKVTEATDIRVRFINETSDKFLHLIKGQLANDYCQLYQYREDIQFEVLSETELYNFSLSLNDYTLSQSDLISISEYTNGRYKVKVQRDYFTDEYIEDFQVTLSSLVYDNTITLSDLDFHIIDTYATKFSGELIAQLEKIQTVVFTFNNKHEQITNFYIEQKELQITPTCKDISEENDKELIYKCDFNLIDITQIGNFKAYFRVSRCSNLLNLLMEVPIQKPPREIIDIQPREGKLSVKPETIQFTITYRYKLIEEDIPDSITLTYKDFKYTTVPTKDLILPSYYLYFDVVKKNIKPGQYEASTNYVKEGDEIIKDKKIILYYNEIEFKERYSYVWERYNMKGLYLELKNEIIVQQIKQIYIEFVPDSSRKNSTTKRWEIDEDFYSFNGDSFNFYKDIEYEFGNYTITVVNFKGEVTELSKHTIIAMKNIPPEPLLIYYPRPARENDYNEITIKGEGYWFAQIKEIGFQKLNGEYVYYYQDQIVYHEEANFVNYITLNVYLEKDEQLKLVLIKDTFNYLLKWEKEIYLRGYYVVKTLFIADRTKTENTFTISLDFYDSVARKNIKDSIRFNSIIQTVCTLSGESIINCPVTTASSFAKDYSITIFIDDKVTRLAQFITYSTSKNTCQYSDETLTDVILTLHMESSRGFTFTAYYSTGIVTEENSGVYVDEKTYNIPIKLTHEDDDSYNTTIQLSTSEDSQIWNLQDIFIKIIRRTAIDTIDENFFCHSNSTDEIEMHQFELNFTVRVNEEDIKYAVFIDENNSSNIIDIKDCDFAASIYNQHSLLCSFFASMEGKYFVTYVDGCNNMKEVDENIYVIIAKTKNVLKTIAPPAINTSSNEAITIRYKEKLDNTTKPENIKLFHKNSGKESSNKATIVEGSIKGQLIDFEITTQKELGLFRIQSIFTKGYSELSPLHLLIYQNKLELKTRETYYSVATKIEKIDIEFKNLIFIEQIHRIYLVEEQSQKVIQKVTDFSLKTTNSNLGNVLTVNLGGKVALTTYTLEIIDRADASESLNFTIKVNDDEFYSFDVENDLFFIKEKSDIVTEEFVIKIQFGIKELAQYNLDNFYILQDKCCIDENDEPAYKKIPCKLDENNNVQCNYVDSHPILPKFVYLSLGTLDVAKAKRKLYINEYNFLPFGFDITQFLYVSTFAKMKFYLGNIELKVNEYCNDEIYAYTFSYSQVQEIVNGEGNYALYAKKEGGKGKVKINNESYFISHKKEFDGMKVENGEFLQAGSDTIQYFIVTFKENIFEGEVQAIRFLKDNYIKETSKCELVTSNNKAVRCSIDLSKVYAGLYYLYYVDQLSNVHYLISNIQIKSAFDILSVSPDIIDISDTSEEITLVLTSNCENLNNYGFKGIRLISSSSVTDVLKVELSKSTMTLKLKPNTLDTSGYYYIYSEFENSARNIKHGKMVVVVNQNDFNFKFEQLYFREITKTIAIKLTYTSTSIFEIDQIFYNNKALSCSNNACKGDITYVSGVYGFTYTIKGYMEKLRIIQEMKIGKELISYYSISQLASCSYYKTPGKFQMVHISGTDILDIDRLHLSIYNVKNTKEIYSYKTYDRENFELDLEGDKLSQLLGKEFIFVIYESTIDKYLYQQPEKITFTDLKPPASIAFGDNSIIFEGATCAVTGFSLQIYNEGKEIVELKYDEVSYSNGKLVLSVTQGVSGFSLFETYYVWINGVEIGRTFISNSLEKATITAVTKTTKEDITVITITSINYYLGKIGEVKIGGTTKTGTYQESSNTLLVNYDSCGLKTELVLIDALTKYAKTISLDGNSEWIFKLDKSYYVYPSNTIPSPFEFTVKLNSGYNAKELIVDGQIGKCVDIYTDGAKCKVYISGPTTIYVTYAYSECYKKSVQVMTYSTSNTQCLLIGKEGSNGKDISITMKVPTYSSTDFKLRLGGQTPFTESKLTTFVDINEVTYYFQFEKDGSYQLTLTPPEGETQVLSNFEITGFNYFEVTEVNGVLYQWSNEQELILTLSNEIEEADKPSQIYLKGETTTEIYSKRCTLLNGKNKISCYFDLQNVGEETLTLFYQDNCNKAYQYGKTKFNTSKQNKLIDVSDFAVRNIKEEITFTYEKSVSNIKGVRINGKDYEISNKSDKSFTISLSIGATGKYPIYTKYGNNKYTLESFELIVTDKKQVFELAETSTSIYQGLKLVRLTIPFIQPFDVNFIYSIVCDNVEFTSYYIENTNLIISIPNSFAFSTSKTHVFIITFYNKSVQFTVSVKEFDACQRIPIAQHLYIRRTFDPLPIRIYAPTVSNLYIKSYLRYKSITRDSNGTYIYTTNNVNEEIYIAFSYDKEMTIYELERPIYLVDGIYRIFNFPMNNCWYVKKQFPGLTLRPGFNFDISSFKLAFWVEGRQQWYENIDGLSEGTYKVQILNGNDIVYSGDFTISGLSLYSTYSDIIDDMGKIYFNSLCNLGNENIYIGGINSPLKCGFDPTKSIYDCAYPYSQLQNNFKPEVYFDSTLIGSVQVLQSFLQTAFNFIRPELIIRGENIFELSSEYSMAQIAKLIFTNQNGKVYSYCNSGCDRTFTVYPSKLQFNLDFTTDTILYLKEIQNIQQQNRTFNDIYFKPEDISFSVDPIYYLSETDAFLPVKIISEIEKTLTINQIKFANLSLTTSPCSCQTTQVCKIPITNFNPSLFPIGSQYLQFYIDNYYYQSRDPILFMLQSNIPKFTYNNLFLTQGSEIIQLPFNNEYIKYLYQYGLINANVYHPTIGSCPCSLLANENYVVNVQCPKAYLGAESIIQMELLNQFIQNITIGGYCDQLQVPTIIGGNYGCSKCSNYYLNGGCLNKCPENYYSYNGQCVESCLTYNLYTQGNKCVSKCDESQGYGLNGKGDGFNLCIKCADNNLALLNGICTANCPSGYEKKNGKCASTQTCTEGYCNNGQCQIVNSKPTCACSASYYGQTCQVCRSQLNIEIQTIIDSIKYYEGDLNLLDPLVGSDVQLLEHMVYQNNSTQIMLDEEVLTYKLATAAQKAINDSFDQDDSQAVLSSLGLVGESKVLKLKEGRRLSENDISFMKLLQEYQEQLIKNHPSVCQTEGDLFGNFALTRCPAEKANEIFFALTPEVTRRLDANYATIDLKPCIEQLTNTEDLTSTYVEEKELKSEQLRKLVEVENGGNIEKYYLNIYQEVGGNLNKLPINTCNNIGITTPFKGQFDVDTPYDYKYYNEKGINVFNASDAAFTELCYVNDKLDFDLPQKYRQELYSMYSGEINQTLGKEFLQKCTIKEFNTKESLLSMICSLGGEKLEEIEEKSIISGEKNLVLKCANHVSSLEENIGFIFYLFIMLIGLVSFGFVAFIEKKKLFGNTEIKQLQNDRNMIEEEKAVITPTVTNTTKAPMGNTPTPTINTNSIKIQFSFCETLKKNFLSLHPILSLFYYSAIAPIKYNVWFLAFSILSLFGFNAIYFNESYIKDRMFASNRQSFGYPLTNEIGKIFLSIITTMCLTFAARVICLVSYKDRKESNFKKYELRRIVSWIFMLIFMLFLFYYSMVFCAIYRKAQVGWAISGFWSCFLDYVIIAPLYIMIITFLQKKLKLNKFTWYMKRLFIV